MIQGSQWNAEPPSNAHFIDGPYAKVPSFDLPLKLLASVSRLRTGHGLSHEKYHFKDTVACFCGALEQTTANIVNECSDRKFEGGLQGIHECDERAIQWIRDFDINL